MKVNLISLPARSVIHTFLRVACQSENLEELQHHFNEMDDFSGYQDKFRFIHGEYCVFVVYIDFDELEYVCTLPVQNLDKLPY